MRVLKTLHDATQWDAAATPLGGVFSALLESSKRRILSPGGLLPGDVLGSHPWARLFAFGGHDRALSRAGCPPCTISGASHQRERGCGLIVKGARSAP